ncbi:hypothetical protein FRACYDRAFT_243199 [Fragilariopsis cylindrus CCMP1102]|uniref:Uncharacterized protein n=1 Tax=Fragilariopsis cylindrus CCMP1102 TaxID=635003 RepID=A0A1E7F479_9STRA|nr:hypothetical protein FRACYDRAFT_243199 [Fragilariopsis cylindrus CCMP1102]|eukprot:OEU12947.1 hypothetical protein FRACYDRAFT_243199 [Fragilariopsis cylindrus CCMP1102]
MSGIRKKGKGRRQGGVTAPAVSQSESNKKRGRPARNNRKSPPATAAPPPGASRQLLLSPPSLLSPACAVSVSSSLTSSSTPRRKVIPPTDTVTGNDHESSPSKFLCLEQEELKVDLASALEVSAENLVETLTSLLIKLNNTAPSSPAVASVTAASPATVETAVAPSAASPVVYSNYTRPSSPIEFDIDAFKVADRSDSAARKGKSRAVNNLVQTILGEHCSNHYSQQQLVLALHTASKDPRVRPFFKSAGLADVEDLAAMRFHHEQINRILITTNDSKKKGSANDDVRSYEQSLYSAMAESPISSNRTTTVPSIASRTRLFSGIPYITLTRCMSRAKAHRKNMRDNNGTVFGRVLKRLGRTKVTPELHMEFLHWLDRHNMVIQSPLASDTLLVPDGTIRGVKKRVNKILLQIPVRELHNDLIDADPLIGLAGARDCNGKILISDTKLRELLPPHLRMMSDRYKIMCGCEPCIQMINLQQSYNRFICYRIKDFKEIRDGFNPRTRRYMAADETLKKYQDKVQPQGEARFKTAKLAMVCCLCAPPDDRFQSLHQLDCVTGECNACPGFDRPPEELTMNNDISFHLYDVLPSCNIHNMLPKFPPVVDGERHANIDDVDTAREEILVSLSSNIAATIEIGGYGAIVTNDEAARDGYWMVEWTSESYTCQETGRLVCDGFYLNEVPGGPQWWTPSGLPVTTPLVNIVMGDVKMDPIEEGRNVPSSSHVSRRQCLEKEALRVKGDSHDYIFDEIFRRETLEYETRAEEEEEDEEEDEEESEEEAE